MFEGETLIKVIGIPQIMGIPQNEDPKPVSYHPPYTQRETEEEMFNPHPQPPRLVLPPAGARGSLIHLEAGP